MLNTDTVNPRLRLDVGVDPNKSTWVDLETSSQDLF